MDKRIYLISNQASLVTEVGTGTVARKSARRNARGASAIVTVVSHTPNFEQQFSAHEYADALWHGYFGLGTHKNVKTSTSCGIFQNI